MKKTFWLMIGLTSFLLGLVGILLPLLPTTPFMLLAAIAFANSYPKLHEWLIKHPHWGGIIQNWRDGGRIDKKSKLIAITFIAIMPLISIILNAPLWAIAIQSVILVIVGTFIFTRPS